MTEPVRFRPVVTADAARAAIDAAVAEAGRLGVAVAVAVVDPAGDPVATLRMDGAPLLSIDVAADKAWTAVAFGQPTTWWAGLLADDPALSALGKNNRLMPVPGGVPVQFGGDVAGGIGISGATADEDDRIAAAGLAPLVVGGEG